MIIGPDMLKRSYGHCGTTRKQTSQIFFVGGRGTWGNSNWAFSPGTQAFDMDRRTFSAISGEMSVGRVFHACTIMEEEGLLIVAGGSPDKNSVTNSVEILNLETETWASARAMPSTGNVWAAGEFLFTWTARLYQYEPMRNQWLEIEDVPFNLNWLKPQFVPLEAAHGKLCHYT